MKRDEFMDKARQELDSIMTGRKNAIMNIIEQAWAEGKRNAELDEITDIVKKALDRAQPSNTDPVVPWMINPIVGHTTSCGFPPEAHSDNEADSEVNGDD